MYKITNVTKKGIQFSGFGDLNISVEQTKQMIDDYQQVINEKQSFGKFEIKHESDDKSHIITSLNMDEYNVITGELKILDTPDGEKLKELVNNSFMSYMYVKPVIENNKIVSLNIVVR